MIAGFSTGSDRIPAPASDFCGVITGVELEARLIRRHEPRLAGSGRLACAGASPERARRLARDLAEAGAPALLSFGLAGGLVSDVPTGTLIVAERVGGGREQPVDCDEGWSAAAASAARKRGLSVRRGILGGSDLVLSDASSKRALHEESGAMAVDMESTAIAAVAAERGLPFLAVRVIADEAGDTVPAVLSRCLDEAGKVRLSVLLRGLLARPTELGPLFRLGRKSARALDKLEALIDHEEGRLTLLGGFARN